MYQTTDTILMISPDSFQYNSQTAMTNYFQNQSAQINNVGQMAIEEFEQMVTMLKNNNIKVIVLPSRQDVITPDAVFPNNWFSIHINNQGKSSLVLYPMLTANRRLERQYEKLKSELFIQGVVLSDLIDLTPFENQDLILEGTGSMVLDRVHKIAYASLSARTHVSVLNEFIAKMDYSSVTFSSYQYGESIYHTNVVMSVGSDFAVICADSIVNRTEREHVLRSLIDSGKVVILITLAQMQSMAGNILEVRSTDGCVKIILSQTAYNAFTEEQRDQLSGFGDLVVVKIDVIEKVGGGSARCMMAEIFHA